MASAPSELRECPRAGAEAIIAPPPRLSMDERPIRDVRVSVAYSNRVMTAVEHVLRYSSPFDR